MRTFRVFISSPGAATVERRHAEAVVSRLNGEFAGLARLQALRWETELYQAHAIFQTQFPKPITVTSSTASCAGGSAHRCPHSS